MSHDEEVTVWAGAWILALLLLIVILALQGCTSSFQGICGAVPIGQNEQGIAFLRVKCEAME